MKNITKEEYQALIKKEKMYREIVEHSRETIIIHSDKKIMYINEAGVELLGASSKEEIIGSPILNIIPEEHRGIVKERMREVLEENKKIKLHDQKIKRYDDTFVEVEISPTPIMYEDQKAIQLVLRDITERKEAEVTLKKALLEINELSAPLVPILEGIAVLPLIGSVDSHRAKHLLDHIPSEIKRQEIQRLIIDFSGLYTLDTMVTDYLFKITAVLRLLGVRCIITGIRPELAQTAIQLGIDLASVQTFATVQQALYELGVKEYLREL